MKKVSLLFVYTLVVNLMLAEEVSWAGNELSQAVKCGSPLRVLQDVLLFFLFPTLPTSYRSSVARAPGLPCATAREDLQNKAVSAQNKKLGLAWETCDVAQESAGGEGIESHQMALLSSCTDI